MSESSKTESMEELRALAEEQWERVLSLEPCVRLDDGTMRSAADLTDEEVFSLTFPDDTFFVWRTRYLAAREGFVYLGGGELKHVDSLRVEDLPHLQASVAAGRAEYGAYGALDEFVTGTLLHLKANGAGIDWDDPFESSHPATLRKLLVAYRSIPGEPTREHHPGTEEEAGR